MQSSPFCHWPFVPKDMLTENLDYRLCVIEKVYRCVKTKPFKREEFSKSLSSAAHWPEEEAEVDWLFHLIWLPHLHAIPILLPSPSTHSLLHFHMALIITVKHSDTFNSSSYLWQTISISTALFSLIGNRIALNSSSFSVSILLWRVHPLALHLIAPSTWPRNQRRGSEGLTSSSTVHSFRAQICGVLAPVIGF